MEKGKLIEEKVAAVAQLCREIAELQQQDETKDFKATALCLITTDDPNDKDGKEMICAALGRGRDLVEMIARAANQSKPFNDMFEEGLRLAPIVGSPLFDIFKAVASKDTRQDDETPCDCPSCRLERGEDTVRRPYERGDEFEKRRKEANKNNPNVN